MKYIVVVYDRPEQWGEFVKVARAFPEVYYEPLSKRLIDSGNLVTYISIKNCLWVNAEKLRGYRLDGYVNISGYDIESDLMRYIASRMINQEEIVEHKHSKVDWNNAPEWADKVGNVKSFTNKNMLAFMNDHQFLFIRGLERGEDPYPFGGAYRAKEEFEIVAERPKSVALEKSGAIKSEWSDKHYNNYYQLSEKDIKEGKVKIDAYFVNKMWKLNEKDDTGALFHCLKTVARFGDKNPIERDLNALDNQVKRMAELYGVELK